MAVFQRPVSVHAAPVLHPAPRPYARPSYVPPPRVITRYVPGPTRTVVTPGPSVTRNFYTTTYVDRGWSPDQRRSYEEGAHRREFERLMQEGRMSREVADAQAAAYAAQQALIASQQAAQAAILNPQQPASAPVSPGSAEADMGPTQDQAAASSEGGDSVSAKPSHLLLIGGIAVGAGLIGYMVLKKKKRASAD